MKAALRIAAQAALYLPLMVLIGVFSTWPRFQVIAPGEALVRVSMAHAGARKAACRTRSAAELAKLAPNMRNPQDCPRERAALLVELEIDGVLTWRTEAKPAGLQRDGASTVYHRMTIPAGRHRIVARLRDTAEGPFNHVREATLDLPAGAALLIDFAPEKGGLQFRT